MSFCTKCGKQNPDIAKFCTGCGNTLSVKTELTATSQPNIRKKYNWILISIVALVGLSAGAYFLFFNKKKAPIETQTQTENNQTLPGLYPYASQRYLSYNDLSSLSRYSLRIMRNEIYARHGFIFQNTEMKNYFNSQSWYIPRFNDINYLLTDIEKKNIELIKQYE